MKKNNGSQFVEPVEPESGDGNDNLNAAQPASEPFTDLHQRVGDPAGLRARVTNHLVAGWRWVTENKLRLFLTVVLLITVIGSFAALYLWRREIVGLIAWVIDKAVMRIRGGQQPISFEEMKQRGVVIRSDEVL